ncbi:MAG: FkbM family methyltransferase [Pseudobacteriovorax sp.]|nr:FkbM family methyltransferase [Pseudobacteriovorax sp.]
MISFFKPYIPIRIKAGLKELAKYGLQYFLLKRLIGLKYLTLIKMVKINGHNIKFFVSNKIELYRTFSYHHKEPLTTNWILNEHQPGDIFFDIGANVGAYSLLSALKIGKNGKVYAFEPAAGTFQTLNTNIQINGLTNILAYPLALSNCNEPVDLKVKSTIPGASGHSIGEALADGKSFEPVRTQGSFAVTLDDFCQKKNTCPNHIKIDVDGLENRVLEGMLTTLKNPNLKSILVEIEGSNSKDLLNIFDTNGFEVQAIEKSNHIFVPKK